MHSHGFSSDERPLVKYIPDYEIAYVYQRYKEESRHFNKIRFLDSWLFAYLVELWYLCWQRIGCEVVRNGPTWTSCKIGRINIKILVSRLECSGWSFDASERCSNEFVLEGTPYYHPEC